MFSVIDLKTGEYPDTSYIALHEDWAKNLIYCDISGFALDEDGLLMLIDDCNNIAYCPHDRFQIVWDDWISVKEKLPDECQNVLITDGEDYAVGTYRDDADAWEHWCYGWLERERDDEQPARLGKITHWKPFTPMKEIK